MANIGAGETYHGYLVKSININEVDSLIKDSVPIEQIVLTGYMQPFRYRYLTETEITQQQLRGWLKRTDTAVIFSSETTLLPSERDVVILEDGKQLRILQKKPQTQMGAFVFTKKPPHVMELA